MYLLTYNSLKKYQNVREENVPDIHLLVYYSCTEIDTSIFYPYFTIDKQNNHDYFLC